MNQKLLDLIFTSLCVAFISVCSFITIPSVVPYTLQTFAIYLSLSLLGAEIGLKSIILYIILGILGAPVFSGFTSGAGQLFGATGGFIIGFIFIGLFFLVSSKTFPKTKSIDVISLIVGTVICYCFGTVWFLHVHIKSNEMISVITILSSCVFPFIIPDFLKLVLALLISKRLKPILSKMRGQE